MKTFGKIFICIIVVLIAIGVAYITYNEKETNGNALTNTNTSTNTTNSNNNKEENKVTNETDENTDYVGEEENKEEPEESQEPATDAEQNQTQELTGKDKGIDIVEKQYALDGQTVRFDHMEGENYVIKMNDGTAVTWYLVNGATWEAEEY